VDEEGKIVFAEATERYARSKRAANITPDLLRHTSRILEEYCDPAAELVAAFSWSEERGIRHTALLSMVDRAQVEFEKEFGELPDYISRELLEGRYLLKSNLGMQLLSGESLEIELNRLAGMSGVQLTRRRFDHHLTHAAAACFTSPFEEAVCAVIDGYGENAAYAFYRYERGRISPLNRSVCRKDSVGTSLGQFYERICQTCGFDSAKGEEWKVMGLAAYGAHDEHLYQLLRPMLVVDDLDLVQVSERRKLEFLQKLHRLRRGRGQPPLAAAHLAFTAQEVFTEVLYELLNNLYARGMSRNLVFAGGCALNSAANGAILESTPFDKLYIFSAPADDGNSVGAALLAWREDHPAASFVPIAFQTPYLGSRLSEESLANLQSFGGIAKLSECSEEAPERAAQMISQGKIIGWVQDRAEFGPRALGNRSILADPRSASMKDQINAKVKFREEFRPFAPSVLHRFGNEYFDHYQESPYMERTLKFRSCVRDRVPAVVHADGTGRLQTVKKDWNEPYNRLVSRFYELTGVPMVLNTSFNVMGKPIAHSVEDALAVFYTTGVDALFLDRLLIEK
jgi:carbamoyltransferase